MRVRRIPTETEAFEINEAISLERDPMPQFRRVDGTMRLYVAKHDEWAEVKHGDIAIRELDGSGWYPCERAVFDATYEVVDPLPYPNFPCAIEPLVDGVIEP